MIEFLLNLKGKKYKSAPDLLHLRFRCDVICVQTGDEVMWPFRGWRLGYVSLLEWAGEQPQHIITAAYLKRGVNAKNAPSEEIMGKITVCLTLALVLLGESCCCRNP